MEKVSKVAQEEVSEVKKHIRVLGQKIDKFLPETTPADILSYKSSSYL